MTSKNIEIEPFNGNDHRVEKGYFNGGGISEIEEDDEELARGFEVNNNSNKIPLSTIREEVTGSSGSLLSFDFHNNGNVVYVEIGKHEEASMDGLVWAMSHAVDPASTVVFLIHIFPEIKQIPTLLGMMPIDQANPEQKELYLARERGKRREYLQKFLNVCSASKAKVDTILIESNAEAKAILDLIPILNIRKLVVGTSKRNIKSRRIGNTAGQILRGAPEYCEVKIICEGKEMGDLIAESPRASNAHSTPSSSIDQDLGQKNTDNNNSLCGSCFKPKINPSSS
ncbi:hypothetical protein LIER_41893 [Lithospermum erythrorhizon]|uniref:Uncharacterized protein n=1 Tax=Lithospermum erythrorhizon TaxID=34254 RepID=A0AAV3RFX3_LITER